MGEGGKQNLKVHEMSKSVKFLSHVICFLGGAVKSCIFGKVQLNSSVACPGTEIKW